jgi:hypothetical protein
MPKVNKKKAAAQETREIIYPMYTQDVYYGDRPITADLAKQWLGWTEGTEEKPLPGPHHLKDENGKKVFLANNTINRPFSDPWARSLAQDILNGNWEMNGENIIIGETGLVLSAQHRLVGLVLASQIWAGDQKFHWHEFWKTEPVLESSVIFGIKEDPKVMRTLDNVKPRTFSDVLYTSEHLADLKASDRKTCATYASWAIKLLWSRTGAAGNAFNPKRTHATGSDFVNNHKTVLKCVRHINDENVENAIGSLIHPGYAAAMMYLMAASASDGDAYRNADPPTEKHADLSRLEKAREFWVLLGSGSPVVREVRHALSALRGEDGSDRGTTQEKLAIITKGWNAFIEAGEVAEADVALRYEEDSDGVRRLVEGTPEVGGIDFGDPNGDDEKPADTGVPGESESDGELTPEELDRRKDEARQIRIEETKRKLAENKAKKIAERAAKNAEVATNGQHAEEETVPVATEPEAAPKPKKVKRKT